MTEEISKAPAQFIDPTDPAVQRFERALWELAASLNDLGVDTVQGPKDVYIVFGCETFEKLRTELIQRPTIMRYFTRPHRKTPDLKLYRWMVAGVQFGDIRALGDAAAREPFWPTREMCRPSHVRFSGGCPSKR